MKGSYDNVASYYEWLSKLFFGNAIQQSQIFLTNSIPPESKILIIGGGTGWILEAIATKHAEGLYITYIDISKKMIEISKTKNTKNNKIDFINKSILDLELNSKYDVIITPFILDNLIEENVEIIINKLSGSLVNKGLWLHSDFEVQKNTVGQQLLMKSMYLFFKVTCNIEATRLPETNSKLKIKGFELISSKKFFHNFIVSNIYQKSW